MENKCVICGATIPEGKMVCPICEYKIIMSDGQIVEEKNNVYEE